jgi:hypothetical protein
MQLRLILVVMVSVALNVAIGAGPEFVIRGSDIGAVNQNGFGLVSVTFKGEKAKEYAHRPNVEQEIRLLITNQGVPSGQYTSNRIYICFYNNSKAIRFYKAVSAECCR